ncbi:MAG TPA: hypothetical protein VFF56_01580 [Bacillota bacterium]|nr:hypothetical protein [Bacillota bacterium]
MTELIAPEGLTNEEWLAEYDTGVRTTKTMRSDTEIRREKNRAIVKALMASPSKFSEDQAKDIVRMIIKGELGSVEINY